MKTFFAIIAQAYSISFLLEYRPQQVAHAYIIFYQ
jgi:hypothetical protein